MQIIALGEIIATTILGRRNALFRFCFLFILILLWRKQNSDIRVKLTMIKKKNQKNEQ
jgi:hypothetical protein